MNKTSILWQITKNELEKIIQKSKTLKEVLNYFGIKNNSTNYQILKERLSQDSINQDHLHYDSQFKTDLFLNQILIENSTYNRGSLKSRLIENDLLENKCNECGSPPTWNNKKLSLVIDHINGINNDNRLENLRILCPNCHSQTNTFAGKNKDHSIVHKIIKKEYNCIDCQISLNSDRSDRCKKCNSIFLSIKYREKNNYPTNDIIVESLKNDNSIKNIAKQLNMPYNLLRKIIKRDKLK